MDILLTAELDAYTPPQQFIFVKGDGDSFTQIAVTPQEEDSIVYIQDPKEAIMQEER